MICDIVTNIAVNKEKSVILNALYVMECSLGNAPASKELVGVRIYLGTGHV